MVMSTSVCVCLSVRADCSGIIGAIFTYFVHVAYGRASVFIRQGDEIPRGLWGFYSPIDNALCSIAFGTYAKWLNRSRCRLGL